MGEIMNIGNNIVKEASGNAEIFANFIPGAGQSMKCTLVNDVTPVFLK